MGTAEGSAARRRADQQAFEEARPLLVKFLKDLSAFIDAVQDERPDIFGARLLPLQDAWAEVKPRLHEAVSSLEVPLNELLKQVPAGRNRASFVSAFVAHGLTGPELRVKLALFYEALNDLVARALEHQEAERFWETWASRLSGSPRPVRTAWGFCRRRIADLREVGREIFAGRYKHVTEGAKVVLGSMKDALSFVPGVGAALGGVIEFIDVCTVAVDATSAGPGPSRHDNAYESLRKVGRTDVESERPS